MSTQLKAQQGLTNLTPIKVIHILISLAIMVCFKFVPAAEPLTPLGVEVIGIFLGMLYGWLIANDSFWPSIFGLLFLGLSSYSTVPAVLRDGFGNSTVLLLFFFFAFTNIISAAGITEYIARWIVSRKVVQGRPYLLTLMIFLAMCALVIMVSCAAATMVIFPLIKEICRLYGVKPGSKWASITLVGTICVGCSFYMLLPFKSLPAVVFSSYTQMSGGDSIALVPYLRSRQKLQPVRWSASWVSSSAAVLPPFLSVARSSASCSAHSRLTVPVRLTSWMVLDVASAIWFRQTRGA